MIPSLGPFCEYVGIFVQSSIYVMIYTNSYILTSILYKQIGIIRWFHTNRYVPIRTLSATILFILGSRVPLSSSLTAFIILKILDEGTFASHKMLINCLSLSDKSFCDSSVASSSRGG